MQEKVKNRSGICPSKRPKLAVFGPFGLYAPFEIPQGFFLGSLFALTYLTMKSYSI